MTADKVKRKLTAILSADVKGYSRLMGEDEEGTLQTLNAYKEVITGFIQRYGGRIVGTAGDSVLAEFISVVDAVKCGVEIQEVIRERNKELAEDRRMEFRIGINLGDVIEEGDTIYGDGVNIAARVQSLAEAGGICISGTVYEHIKNKLAFGYEYVGEQVVRNIKGPVRIYQVVMEPGVRASVGVAESKVEKKPRQIRMVALGAVIVIVAAAVIGYFYLRSTPPPREGASKEKMAFPIPDKPSIAVLPFVNMSEDPKQEYFSDGMTEDLITDLSKISGLLVIARNSTFTYKGKAVKVKQVAEELGVRYVLEGSVRRAGDEIRINAQLIDAMTGHHLWAERYDGTMGKIFALQDQITQKIVSALAVKLTGNEKQIIAQKGTNNIDAYDEFLRGWVNYLRYTPDDLAKAIQSFKKAIELDPNYGRPYAGLALAYFMGAVVGGLSKGLEISRLEARLRAWQYLKMAMKNPTSIARTVNAQYYLFRRQHVEAVAEIEQALALDPNDPSCNVRMAVILNYSGKPKEAIDFANRAMLLDPHNPAYYFLVRGYSQFSMGNLEEAVTLCEKALKLTPEVWGYNIWLVSAYSLLGREKEARIAFDNHNIPTGGSGPLLVNQMHFHPWKDRAIADRFAEGLIKGGIRGGSSGYFPTFKENQLTGEEIKRLTFGSKITGISSEMIKGLSAGSKPTGINQDTQQWWIDSKKNGEFIWRGGEPISVDTGKSRIEGDMICMQQQKLYWGLEYCGTVFRNPKGTYEGKDEYVTCTDWGFVPWSVVR